MEKIPLGRISKKYGKLSPIHDYSQVYTRPSSLDSINNKCSNTVIMNYTNKDFTGNLNLENVCG